MFPETYLEKQSSDFFRSLICVLRAGPTETSKINRQSLFAEQRWSHQNQLLSMQGASVLKDVSLEARTKIWTEGVHFRNEWITILTTKQLHSKTKLHWPQLSGNFLCAQGGPRSRWVGSSPSPSDSSQEQLRPRHLLPSEVLRVEGGFGFQGGAAHTLRALSHRPSHVAPAPNMGLLVIIMCFPLSSRLKPLVHPDTKSKVRTLHCIFNFRKIENLERAFICIVYEDPRIGRKTMGWKYH